MSISKEIPCKRQRGDWPSKKHEGNKIFKKLRKSNNIKKLKQRNCKEVLGAYSKKFLRKLTHFCILYNFGGICNEKLTLFKTPKKTR